LCFRGWLLLKSPRGVGQQSITEGAGVKGGSEGRQAVTTLDAESAPVVCCCLSPSGVMKQQDGGWMSVANGMTVAEIIDLACDDFIFYGQHYFPKTVRQETPDFHHELADVLDSNAYEKIAAKVFRGGAKTSWARILLSKRIAYSISRTILIVSETAEHSYESVKWLKRAVERKDHWATDFGLLAGNDYENPETKERYTWRDDKIQIVCTNTLDVNGRPVVVTIVGTGIFGQSRGLNIEDYRPDFILLDDVQDEDNAKTAEQREKVNSRIYGAIVNTLTPRSENPTATILMLQTPLNQFDAIEMAKKDPEWKYLEYSCFDETGRSRWEARLPTAELLRKKQGFIARNQLSLWMREMEVTVISSELSIFVNEWFLNNTWAHKNELPEDMVVYLGIDPTPPPKPNEQKSSDALRKLDNTVFTVIGCRKRHVYVLEVYACKSPLPIEFMNKFFELCGRWRPRKVGFESVLFARTYAYSLNDAMIQRRSFFQIECIEDRRSKSNRIRDEISEIAFQGQLHVKNDMSDLLAEALQYPDVSHDDYLDSLSIALMCRNQGDILEGVYEDVTDDVAGELGDWRVGLIGH